MINKYILFLYADILPQPDTNFVVIKAFFDIFDAHLATMEYTGGQGSFYPSFLENLAKVLCSARATARNYGYPHVRFDKSNEI